MRFAGKRIHSRLTAIIQIDLQYVNLLQLWVEYAGDGDAASLKTMHKVRAIQPVNFGSG